MKLPSLREIDDALMGMADEGPIPLAGICDQHEILRETICVAVQHVDHFGLEQAIKTGFVQGLNIGIRIGEARGRK